MIHALPGMGADQRMFPTPWDTLPEFTAHDWPPHRGEKTLAEVAVRLCREFEINDGDIVIGTSLGGMVACEVAKVRKLNALYLVGSATAREEVSRLLAILHPLADLAPLEWLRHSAARLPSDVARMFAGAEPSFIRQMCRAIFEWEGLGSVPIRCVRIHGRRDIVIPAPQRAELLLNGGHLITMTHARECVSFIEGLERR
jgi:pimeloyl-ACP methyl ester carboxylesterase